MRRDPPGGTARGRSDRALLAVVSYLLWLVSVVVGLAGIFAIYNLAKLVLALTLGRGGDEVTKWSGPALITITGVAGLVLLVLILFWEDRYRRESQHGFRPLLRKFGRVTAGEVAAIVVVATLWLALLRFGI